VCETRVKSEQWLCLQHLPPPPPHPHEPDFALRLVHVQQLRGCSHVVVGGGAAWGRAVESCSRCCVVVCCERLECLTMQ
jgi:hypothetical protein